MRIWKSTIRDGERYLPLRHCVAIGCEVLAFNSANDATRAYNALAKAVGRRDLIRFTFKPVSVVGEMPTFEGREYGLSPDLKLALDARNIGTEAEVEGVIEWHQRVTCDGTGVCSCWNHEEGHDTPNGWWDFVKDGVVKHMCPKCQEKDIKLAPPQPSC